MSPSSPPFPLTRAMILAGGLGRRMNAPAHGALEKPLVRLGGAPLIAHVIDRLRPQVDQLWINANSDAEAYAGLGCELVPDTLAGHPGPLAGVLAGLERLAAEDAGASLLTVPADIPFLPGDLAERLRRRQAETGGLVCAGSLGQRHPVIALWPASARTALRQSLEAGRLKVGLFLDTLNAVTEVWDSEPDDPFFNVNTPEDLAIAEIRRTARQ
ncbi:UNVERIFIED_ORG: molybdopterin-guanine dinucleotide biosynthesis protein A [Xanthobacter viscosus]|uniref:Molybdenum cofactor guanylyltransferase n=1 Tax=Xanthobacter autotrophicus TaxID=280 RepID=A0A6C1KH75_XANAU|nr:molybdenum cofactor guanylyltransferase MobA [Xanthobacter autotrophicus]TLX43540.1 molybdenum cofactor guanylyltransferase MobA [Xanthobacter autotrophicus]